MLVHTNHINKKNALHPIADAGCNKKHVHHGFLTPRRYLCSTSLKKRKATGFDQIPNEVLMCDKLLPYLCRFFNVFFDYGITPTSWSQSIISPVPKGSMTEKYVPLQYRGISLFSCVYKLYSVLLNKRLYSFLDVQDWFDDAQNGFRRGRSCEDHIFFTNLTD